MRLVIKGTISINHGLSPIRSKSSITFVMEDFLLCDDKNKKTLYIELLHRGNHSGIKPAFSPVSLPLSQTVTTTPQNGYAAGKQAVSNAEEANVIGAGQQAYEAYNTAQAITDPKGEASLTVGVSSLWKSSESYSTTAVRSELCAGRDMSLAANRDVSMQGTQAQADRDMTMAGAFLWCGRCVHISAGGADCHAGQLQHVKRIKAFRNDSHDLDP